MKTGGILRAAKIINGGTFTEQVYNRERYMNEILIPMKLDHPNIIKLFEVFQHKDEFVLIEELCEGGDLFSKIQKGRMLTEKKVS